MAVKDVKDFYLKTSAQYLEMKETLAEFEKEFKEGHITEDKLDNVKDLVNFMEQNYDRLSYIMYLFELPNRPKKKAKAQKANQKLEDYFKSKKADKDSISTENKSSLDNLRVELKKIVIEDRESQLDTIDKQIAEYDAKYSLKSKQN